MTEITHNDLAANLAAHLRSSHCNHRVTWENLAFSDWSKPDAALHCRPDVFSIFPTLDVERCRPWTHEVKVSRADFLSDIRSAKWRQYTEFSCRVFFAAPRGLIDPIELPKETGLWEFDHTATCMWRLVKPAKFCKGWSLPPRHLMKLILGRWGTFAGNLPTPPLTTPQG
jgi:hypothetical protein